MLHILDHNLHVWIHWIRIRFCIYLKGRIRMLHILDPGLHFFKHTGSGSVFNSRAESAFVTLHLGSGSTFIRLLPGCKIPYNPDPDMHFKNNIDSDLYFYRTS